MVEHPAYGRAPAGSRAGGLRALRRVLTEQIMQSKAAGGTLLDQARPDKFTQPWADRR
jgi:hypothetical protein